MRYFHCGAVVLVILLSILGGCGPGFSGDGSDTAIQVNDVRISIEEFNDLIKLQAYSDPEMNITRESRKEYVDYLIRKELMLQEAVRLEMDRRDDFIKTIETYWESALIRRLLDHKTMEIKKKVLITQEETKAYYAAHKEEFARPYEAVKEQIKKILVSQRVQKSLEDWTRGLRKGAKVRINQELTANRES